MLDELLPIEDLTSGPPAFGAASASDVATALGEALSGAAEATFRDPEVQAMLTAAAGNCKEQAKAGVGEWVQENRNLIVMYTAVTLIVLGFLHTAGSTIALNLAFPRGVRPA